MSRPSATQSPSARISCWRRTSAARTPWSRATWDASPEISGVRIASVTSRPSSSTRSPTSIRERSATAAGSSPDSSVPSATQRYIAPVSRYVKPSRSATARATVDLPAPAGPSMAITMALRLDELAQVGLEAGVGDGRRLHPHDLDAAARGQPGDRAEHRQPVVAVGRERAALQPARPAHGEAVLGRLDVGAEPAQPVHHGGDAVG